LNGPVAICPVQLAAIKLALFGAFAIGEMNLFHFGISTINRIATRLCQGLIAPRSFANGLVLQFEKIPAGNEQSRV
jgi:hypothetical protein